MKHTIHVHQQLLRKGEPAIIDRTYKGSLHSRSVQILCPKCSCVAATVVQPEEPDACGARAYIVAEKTSIGEVPEPG